MPTVVLVGDSIRMGYEPFVRQELASPADEPWIVVSPPDNGGTSSNVLAHLDAWCIAPRPDVVHLNCGLHDLKREFGADSNNVSLNEYVANLDTVFRRLREETQARIIWATITPVNYAWHHANKPFDRFEEDVDAYNEAALRIARRYGLAVDDLHDVVVRAGRDRLLLPDGVHYTQDGYALLGKVVCEALRAAV